MGAGVIVYLADGEPMPSDPPTDWRDVPPPSCPFCGADGEPSTVLAPGWFWCASCRTTLREVVMPPDAAS